MDPASFKLAAKTKAKFDSSADYTRRANERKKRSMKHKKLELLSDLRERQ